MSVISMVLVVIVAFLAGMEGVLEIPVPSAISSLYINRTCNRTACSLHHPWR